MRYKCLPRMNAKTWLLHFSTMMLMSVVIPLVLFAALVNIAGAEVYGLRVGQVYFGISYLVFGDLLGNWLDFLRGMLTSFPQSKAEIILIIACWTLLCVVIASILAIARLMAACMTRTRIAPNE